MVIVFVTAQIYNFVSPLLWETNRSNLFEISVTKNFWAHNAWQTFTVIHHMFFITGSFQKPVTSLHYTYWWNVILFMLLSTTHTAAAGPRYRHNNKLMLEYKEWIFSSAIKLQDMQSMPYSWMLFFITTAWLVPLHQIDQKSATSAKGFREPYRGIRLLMLDSNSPMSFPLVDISINDGIQAHCS